MTKVLFFGKLSDDIGERSIELPPVKSASVNDVIKILATQRKASWQPLLSDNSIIAAVDKNITHDKSVLHDVINELAFFPPVTGG